MAMTEVLNATEVAKILGTSTQAIRNAISRGREGIIIPPSFKLGSNRRWRRKDVYAWLDEKSAEYKSTKRRGRPRLNSSGNLSSNLIKSSSTKMDSQLNKEIATISPGNLYRDNLSEQEFSVMDIYPEYGYAEIELEDNDEVIQIDEFLQAIREGRFVLLSSTSKKE